MKKSFLTAIVAILATTSIVTAAPQFGIGAFSALNAGTNVPGKSGAAVEARSAIFPGLYITDDMYTVTLGLGSSNNGADGAAEVSPTTISLDVNYKLALNSVTAATVGIGYTTISGKLGGGNEIDSASILDLNVGVERDLGNSLLLVGTLTVYSSQTVEVKDEDNVVTKEVDGASTMFQGGKVGLVYLF